MLSADSLYFALSLSLIPLSLPPSLSLSLSLFLIFLLNTATYMDTKMEQ